jgi:hypothetical protein
MESLRTTRLVIFLHSYGDAYENNFDTHFEIPITTTLVIFLHNYGDS